MSINDKNITKSSIHHAMDNILCDTNTNVGVEVTEDIKTPLQSAPSKTNTEDPACPPSSAPQSIEHKNLFSCSHCNLAIMVDFSINNLP